MKKIFFSIAFMLIGSFAFANTSEIKPTQNLSSIENINKSEIKKVDEVVKSTCKVTITFGGNTVSIINTCDCSMTAACDGAYKIARLATML